MKKYRVLSTEVPTAVAATLKDLGNPAVVFPTEVFTPGEIRQPGSCHAVMLSLGYIPVGPVDGDRWRWYGQRTEFGARWAYANPAATTDIGAEIDARGAAKVGRP